MKTSNRYEKQTKVKNKFTYRPTGQEVVTDMKFSLSFMLKWIGKSDYKNVTIETTTFQERDLEQLRRFEINEEFENNRHSNNNKLAKEVYICPNTKLTNPLTGITQTQYKTGLF